MLRMMANTDPITVKNPFTPQAQGISEGACLLIISIPAGKGIPNKMPKGMIRRIASITRAGMDKAIATLSSEGRSKLATSNKADRTMMESRSVLMGFILYFLEMKAPAPVNNKSAESTIAKV
jgi:hypothetical protein